MANNIVCGFCNAPWTERMEVELYSISAGCDTCDYGREIEIDLTITCDGCGRVIYKKRGVPVE